MPQAREAVQGCEGSELYRRATQAVFGEGRPAARIAMVGEQPGDKEDLAGHPFVGPAGVLLNKALEEAGIDPSDVYVTHAVKHFKFEERGKRRIIAACKPWLEAELVLLRPQLIVCLGATAGKSVIGNVHRVLQERGKFFCTPPAVSRRPFTLLRSYPAPGSTAGSVRIFRGRLKGHSTDGQAYEISHLVSSDGFRWAYSCTGCMPEKHALSTDRGLWNHW